MQEMGECKMSFERSPGKALPCYECTFRGSGKRRIRGERKLLPFSKYPSNPKENAGGMSIPGKALAETRSMPSDNEKQRFLCSGKEPG